MRTTLNGFSMFLEGFFVENLLGFCQGFFRSIWVVYASGCGVRQRLFELVRGLNFLHSFCSKLKSSSEESDKGRWSTGSGGLCSFTEVV